MMLLQLFFEFFLIGLFAVGGGLATIPYLQDLAVRTNWFTIAELSDMIAVSESTPGPIGINMATYVGFRSAGIPGILCAVVGIVAPCVITAIIISRIIDKFNNSKIVDWTFRGLRPASCALIAAAGYELLKIAVFAGSGPLGVDIPSLVMLAAMLPIMLKTKLHPLFYIAISAVIGVIFKF